MLSNAVYHKSYELGSPIEIQVFPDKITVLSYPGPMPPVDRKVLKNEQHIFAREYRNRRIGDFLKELHLTEGRGTGFPIIYKAMANNGSPAPVFETDDKTHTLVTLKVHPEYLKASDEIDVADISSKLLNINSLNELKDCLMKGIDGALDGALDGASAHIQKLLETTVHSKVKEFLQAALNWVI